MNIIKSTLEEFDGIEANEMLPANCTPEEARDKILRLEQAMIDLNQGHECNEPNHYFAPGMYGRELYIRQNELIVGKIHRHAHINIISRGVIDVYTEFGRVRYDATDKPVVFVSEPGTKRVVKAITDTIWMTIHATHETDLSKIEEEVIVPSYENLIGEIES